MTPDLLPLARLIAETLGFDFDTQFASKAEWNAERGIKGGRFHDINEPMQSDFVDAAAAVRKVVMEGSSRDLSLTINGGDGPPPVPSPTPKWRCTRCGRDEIDCHDNGCDRGPCPMEYVG